MLIHIEWVDLCWKTTLIDKIELLFKNVVVFKTPKNLLPRKDSLKEREKIRDYYIKTLEWIIQDFEKDPNQIYILDRFFFSELVYWKVMRGYDSEDMKPELNKVLDLVKLIQSKRWYKLLYLQDDTEDIWKRFQRDWDDYIKDKKYFHNLKWAYLNKIKQNLSENDYFIINTFKDKDYWNKIIEEAILSNYHYVRHG